MIVIGLHNIVQCKATVSVGTQEDKRIIVIPELQKYNIALSSNIRRVYIRSFWYIAHPADLNVNLVVQNCKCSKFSHLSVALPNL